MKYANLILSFTLLNSVLIGDYVVFKSKYSSSQLFRAFTDSLVHLIVGFLSALIFFSYNIKVSTYACVCNVVFCTFLSWIIDIDHAIAAKSFYLKDMTNLKQRGIFHCTTFWAAISIISFTYSVLAKKLNIYLLSFMIILAISSHHIRDANRRGLWVYPFGHTHPIPKYLYVTLLTVLPHVYVFLYKCTEALVYKDSVMYVKVSDVDIV